MSVIASFLLRASCVGVGTGLAVVAFKKSILLVSFALYESLADLLPKGVPYWPIALFPFLGAVGVALLTLVNRKALDQNIDAIARTTSVTILSDKQLSEFRPLDALVRSLAAVLTLGSG